MDVFSFESSQYQCENFFNRCKENRDGCLFLCCSLSNIQDPIVNCLRNCFLETFFHVENAPLGKIGCLFVSKSEIFDSLTKNAVQLQSFDSGNTELIGRTECSVMNSDAAVSLVSKCQSQAPVDFDAFVVTICTRKNLSDCISSFVLIRDCSCLDTITECHKLFCTTTNQCLIWDSCPAGFSLPPPIHLTHIKGYDLSHEIKQLADEKEKVTRKIATVKENLQRVVSDLSLKHRFLLLEKISAELCYKELEVEMENTKADCKDKIHACEQRTHESELRATLLMKELGQKAVEIDSLKKEKLSFVDSYATELQCLKELRSSERKKQEQRFQKTLEENTNALLEKFQNECSLLTAQSQATIEQMNKRIVQSEAKNLALKSEFQIVKNSIEEVISFTRGMAETSIRELCVLNPLDKTLKNLIIDAVNKKNENSVKQYEYLSLIEIIRHLLKTLVGAVETAKNTLSASLAEIQDHVLQATWIVYLETKNSAVATIKKHLLEKELELNAATDRLKQQSLRFSDVNAQLHKYERKEKLRKMQESENSKN